MRGGRLHEVPNVVIWPKNFWYFGNWSQLQPEVRLYLHQACEGGK